MRCGGPLYQTSRHRTSKNSILNAHHAAGETYVAKNLATANRTEAGELLQRVDDEPNQNPESILVLYEWQGIRFLGRLLRLYPEKPYIVFVTKASEPLSTELARALRRLRPVPLVRVHPKVEFAGPRYLLGLTGDTLCLLSGEDILYCHVHPRDHTGKGYRVGAE